MARGPSLWQNGGAVPPGHSLPRAATYHGGSAHTLTSHGEVGGSSATPQGGSDGSGSGSRSVSTPGERRHSGARTNQPPGAVGGAPMNGTHGNGDAYGGAYGATYGATYGYSGGQPQRQVLGVVSEAPAAHAVAVPRSRSREQMTAEDLAVLDDQTWEVGQPRNLFVSNMAASL